MMKKLNTMMLAAMALASVGMQDARANLYPIYPPGTYVDLQPDEFILSVPVSTENCTFDWCNVIGDWYNNHPGASVNYPGDFFVGLFARPLDASRENSAVYLWETKGNSIDLQGDAGPLVSIGYWDGLSYVMKSAAVVPASYYGVQEYVTFPGVQGRYAVNASVIPFSAFNLAACGYAGCNAVMVSYNALAEDRVTAIGIPLVPEPASVFLLVAGLLGYRLQRKSREA